MSWALNMTTQCGTNPESLYEHIKKLQDPTTDTEVLDASRRFNADPSKTKDAKKHSHLLWLLATSGYAGGELLDIPRNVRKVTRSRQGMNFNMQFIRMLTWQFKSASSGSPSKRLLWISFRTVARLVWI